MVAGPASPVHSERSLRGDAPGGGGSGPGRSPVTTVFPAPAGNGVRSTQGRSVARQPPAGEARFQPAHVLAFLNMRSHGPASPRRGGSQEYCTARMVRSGCGIMIVTRPSGVVRPVTPASEPLGLAG